MAAIVGVCGSLRRASFNMMLLRAVAEAVPEGSTIHVASIADIPPYNGDVEGERGIPESVQQLKEQIASADGLLIVTPEYNNSIPGVLKNAIDWASRPSSDIRRVFRGRPVAVIGATTGQGATRLAQAAWLPVVRSLGMRPWFDALIMIPGAAKVFDGEGRLVDPATRDRVRAFAEGFAAFAAERR
jgi:NAD(P)H-dependent FMN reductase